MLKQADFALACQPPYVFPPERSDVAQVNSELAALPHVREDASFAPPPNRLDADREMARGLFDGYDPRRNALLARAQF